MSGRERIVLVIGATSSLAQALCRHLAKDGYSLILAGRDSAELQLLAGDLSTRHLAHCRCLTTDLLAPAFSATELLEAAGDFDDAVIATGDMGGDNKDDPANIAAITEINYTRPAQIASAIAAQLCARGGGRLVIIASVAGDRGRQSNYLYGAAKGALSTFASGLRNRYAKKNVQVMTVKPGFIDTPMTWNMSSPLIASREKVASDIAWGMEKGRDVLYTPFFWRFIMLIIIHIPERVFKKLKL